MGLAEHSVWGGILSEEFLVNRDVFLGSEGLISQHRSVDCMLCKRSSYSFNQHCGIVKDSDPSKQLHASHCHYLRQDLKHVHLCRYRSPLKQAKIFNMKKRTLAKLYHHNGFKKKTAF